MRTITDDRPLAAADLSALLDDPRLIDVHFQPVIGFDTRTVCGAEALLRARIGDVAISPASVVAAAIAAGRIRELGRLVLARACEAHRVWHAAGHPCIVMMVNADAVELLDPNFVADTQDILDRYGLPGEQLVLELTETALIEDHPIVRSNLADLRWLGVAVALDDFGTGYASLSHLQSVPLTMVKLDRQFIAHVDRAGTAHEIVRNVVRLGHALGLRVVAEGVETETQRRALQALGCDAWQGFLRSPAIDVDAFVVELAHLPESGTADSGDEGAIPGLVDLDSFVLRRIGGDRWAHIGGHGRGEGWAGIVEIDAASAPLIARSATEVVQRVEHLEQRWLVGPYHPRSSITIRLDDDTVVIFGSMTDSHLPGARDDLWIEAARRLGDATTSVSPAKRLADELEMSQALQVLISGSPTTLDEAMRHVIASVAGALSCEFGVLYLPAVGLIAFDDHTIHDVDISAIRLALDRLSPDITGMTCVQNAAEQPLPLPLPTDFGVRSWIAFPTSPSLGGLIVCAHTDRGPRGFTAMCQQLGRKLADSAELVLHAAVERERLLSEASTATVEARMDSLTGLLNRRGWDDAVRRFDADPERNFSVVVADLNDLKAVNDSLGHAAGDRLLRAAARCLSNLVRNDDVVARIGGDEFAILMRDTEDAVCRRLVAQLEALLEIERIATPELSVAAGFATNQGGESAFETVRRADDAMYACKLRLKQARTAGTGRVGTGRVFTG